MKIFRGILILIICCLTISSSVSAAELFEKDLKFGNKGLEVKRLQTLLKDEGFYSGPISGNFLSMTQKSLRNYQNNYKLKVTGKLDKNTRKQINDLLLSKEYTPEQTTPVSETQRSNIELVTLYYNNYPTIITSDMVEMALNSGYTRRPTTQQKDPEITRLESEVEKAKQHNEDLKTKIAEEEKKIVEESKIPETLKKKAKVTIIGQTYTKVNVWGWNINESSYSSANKTITYYYNTKGPYESKLDINVSYGNPVNTSINDTREKQRVASETQDFKCVKSGNEFWQGSTQSTVDGDVYNPVILDTKKLVENYMGKDLRFEVTCTNLDGATSSDYFMLHISNEAK